MRPIAPSLPAVDDPSGPRLVLRDGTVAAVRPATHADLTRMRDFFDGLSPESRYRRFLSVTSPSDTMMERLSDSSDPTKNFTLIAERLVEGELQIVAAATYVAVGDGVAEAAFTVADEFQGKGLGTALLERLAVIAAGAGIHSFQATT